MSYFSALFFFLFFGTCTVAQDKVFFLNKTGRQVLVQKRTILEQGSYPHTLDSNGRIFQSIELQISSPVILNVTSIPPKGPYGTPDGIYFLFKPGDSLVIELDNTKKPVISHITRPQRTEELSFFRQHIEKLKIPLPYQLYGFNQNQSLHRRIWSTDFKSRDKIIDSLYRPYLNTVTDFFPDNSISPDAQLWYHFYLGSLITNKLFVGLKTDPVIEASLKSFYADSLNKWRQELNGEGCENIPPYNGALYAVYSLQFGHLGARKFMDTVSVLATGSNKNFLLSRYMDLLIRNTNDESLFDYYQTLCEDSFYTKTVNENFWQRKKQMASFKKEAAVLTKADKSEAGFTQLIASLKGKVIYVDFWASWCKPCIEELPYSHQLSEKLKGKDVAFLYISIDDDFNSWRKAASKYNIAGNNSVMMPSADQTALAKQIELGPIPRYLIINKEGRIVNLQAPRPSDQQTYDLLVKMLK